MASILGNPTLLSKSLSAQSFQRICRRSIVTHPRFKPGSQVPANPIVERYLKNKPSEFQPPETKLGTVAEDSIFADQEKSRKVGTDVAPQPEAKQVMGGQPANVQRNLEAMALVLDPVPDKRRRWERKMVIKQIRKRGEQTKAEILKRTEREYTSKSHFIKTSTKKLGMLARQIAGKSLDDAIVQMRFSKKKAAQDVKAQLEIARDEAIVTRGMGLGQAGGVDGETAAPIEIRLKDGSKKRIANPSDIYVAQAWVGRGKYEKEQEFRAKGRVNILCKPYTSISVMLKEETTRIRLHEEALEKRSRRKLWTQLPDRPVTEQRQYPLW